MALPHGPRAVGDDPARGGRPVAARAGELQRAVAAARERRAQQQSDRAGDEQFEGGDVHGGAGAVARPRASRRERLDNLRGGAAGRSAAGSWRTAPKGSGPCDRGFHRVGSSPWHSRHGLAIGRAVKERSGLTSDRSRPRCSQSVCCLRRWWTPCRRRPATSPWSGKCPRIRSRCPRPQAKPRSRTPGPGSSRRWVATRSRCRPTATCWNDCWRRRRSVRCSAMPAFASMAGRRAATPRPRPTDRTLRPCSTTAPTKWCSARTGPRSSGRSIRAVQNCSSVVAWR